MNQATLNNSRAVEAAGKGGANTQARLTITRLKGVEPMAGKQSSNPRDGDKRNEPDPFARAVIYRLRRDALMIVSNMNRGRTVANDAAKRQLVFVQAQLCTAAVADPSLPDAVKSALVKFQAATISENIEDRRGQRRRAAFSNTVVCRKAGAGDLAVIFRR